VEPALAVISREVSVIMPVIILKSARVIEETNAWRPFSFAHKFLPRLNKRLQASVAPMQIRLRIMFGRCAPKDHQRDINTRGLHVEKLFLVPAKGFVRE